MKVTAQSPVEQIRSQSPVRTREAAPQARNDNAAHAYYNRAVHGIEDLRNVKIRPGVLENLLADARVDTATQPSLRDNTTARDLKTDYKELYDRTREQQRAAQGLADSLGPGSHQLLDGSTVTVKENKDGSTTVTTVKPDGSQTVAELSGDPSQFKFTATDASGFFVETTERDGSTLNHRNGGMLGSGVEYRLDEQGNPQRTVRGVTGVITTRVNEDGSTDTWPHYALGIPGPIQHQPPNHWKPLPGER